MKKFFAFVVLALACTPVAVFAMSQSAIPPKFPIPWGNSAGSAYIRSIPQSSQIGVQNGAASLTDGFPPLTFVPSIAGGVPPFGQDFNGFNKQVSQWAQWQSAGGPVFYDSGFSASIGGYPKGAMLQSSVLVGRIWFSTADNNSTNPDDQTGGAANWIALPGTALPGQPIPVLSSTAIPNAVFANGLTVGNTSSNATSRANPDTFWLFSFLWTNCAPCTLFNSAGTPVAKGANAIADWAANRAIATNNMNGSGLMGADSMTPTTSTNLSSVPVTSGSRTVPGSILGENLHQLLSGEAPTITSINAAQSILVTGSLGVTVSPPGGFPFIPVSSLSISNGQFTSTATVNIAPSNNNGNWTGVGSLSGSTSGSLSGPNSISVTSNNTGNGSHNTVERSTITYWNLSL